MLWQEEKSLWKTERSSLSVNDMNSEERIIIGRIVTPHGVRGDLRVLPDIEHPEIFKTLKTLFIGDKLYKIISARPHKHIYILRAEGVNDRNMAETLVNQVVKTNISDLPELKQGEYYYFQLLRLSVVSDEGKLLGRIKEIIETGANDVYTVADEEGKEIYLPAIPSCILSVDMENKVMTVHLPEWE